MTLSVLLSGADNLQVQEVMENLNSVRAKYGQAYQSLIYLDQLMSEELSEALCDYSRSIAYRICPGRLFF